MRSFSEDVLDYDRPFLSADLTRGPSLRTDEGAESVDLFHDEALHSLDGVFFFEAEVEFLSSKKIRCSSVPEDWG